MRLHEIAMTGDRYFKGVPKKLDVVPDNAFDLRIEELKGHIEGWKDLYNKLPDKDAVYAEQTAYRIKDMEQELLDYEEIGELPFTFYAAKDREHAEYFQAQFEDGVIDEVEITAKNIATVKDLHSLGFSMKRTVSHLTPIMIHKLKKAGFDAAAGPIDNIAGGDEIVVFSPEQVKRV